MRNSSPGCLRILVAWPWIEFITVSRVRKIEGNPNFCNKDVVSSQQNTVTSAVNQSQLPHEAAVTSYQGGDSHILYQHAALVHFPVVPFVEDMNMLFQRLLPVVMYKAIKEILSIVHHPPSLFAWLEICLMLLARNLFVIRWSCCLDTNAFRAASASADFTVKIWDALTGDELHLFDHKHIVRACSFSEDTHLLLTGGFEKILRILDLNRLDALPREVEKSSPGSMRTVAWLHSDQTILSSCSDSEGVSFLQKLWMLFKTLIGSFLLEMLLQSSMSFIHMMMSILHYFTGLFWCWIKWSFGLVCASGKEPTQCPQSSGTFHLYFLCIQGLVQCFSCVCSKGDQLIKSNLLNNNILLKQVSNQD
ncbi:unnamed protein product [Lactuca saligna]|uniref:Serine-threonine kinase receptor-associated protein n=1 Tax=Lactuca saligna TaxID=75948 RepID=A0AA35V5T9_LACSI|nr:unnamed protein product [Lactuca saligna]